jgi:Na+/H+-dicarboxylate symporter
MNNNGNSESNFGLLIGIVIAIVVGALVGGFLPGFAKHTHILGDIFLTLLKMVVVPLVIFSMVVGITNLGDIRSLGSIGGRTVLYYMATTAISVIIGMILVNIISPGKGIDLSEEGDKYPQLTYTLSGENNLTVTLQEDQIKEGYTNKFIITLVDQNLVGEIDSVEGNQVNVANWQDLSGEIDYIITESGKTLMIAENQFTNLKVEPSGTGVDIALPKVSEVKGKEDRTMGQTLLEVFLGNSETGKQGMIPSNIFMAMANMDILPLIFFSLFIGAALSVIGEVGKPAIAIFKAFNEAVMQIVNWIMIIAPVGIFGLIAGRIGEAGGFAEFLPELAAVGKYSMTVVIALGFHGIVVLPTLLFIFGRRNPVGYAQGMGTALLNAFSTASSSATLPLTMENVEEQNGISNRTASFVLPLGATINMDGTALYETVAVMFIAQVYGITMGPAEQLIIVLTATLAAIGAAGIPEAGLVTMVIVLKAVDLPIEGVALILSIDWLLDRFRTTVNVWGDSVGAGIIETYESGETTELPAT